MAEAATPATTAPSARRPAPRRRADPALRALRLNCRRRLSERGGARGPTISAEIGLQIDRLTDAGRDRFFSHLANDFSPDPLDGRAGQMVNCLYDLNRIERCQDRFVRGHVVHSRALPALL